MGYVIDTCKSEVIGDTFPKHRATIEFCERLGFVRVAHDRVGLTELGLVMLRFNPGHNYELNESETQLVRRILCSEKFGEDFRKLLAQFSKDYSEQTYVLSKTDDPPLRTDPRFLNILFQLGILVENEREIKVMPEFAPNMAKLLGSPRTLEQLREIMERQNAVGEIAEELTVRFEKERLRDLGCDVEAELVRRISILDTGAGYDIESFEGKSPDLNYDRFIEVKASTGSSIRFFWSRNEIDVAKRLGDKYWIYFMKKVEKEVCKMFRTASIPRPRQVYLGQQ